MAQNNPYADTDPTSNPPAAAAAPASGGAAPAGNFGAAIGAALDDIERLNRQIAEINGRLADVPAGPVGDDQRKALTSQLTQASQQLSAAHRKMTDIQSQAARTPGGRARSVPTVKTSAGVWTKDGPPDESGQPIWRQAEDANGNPIPGVGRTQDYYGAQAERTRTLTQPEADKMGADTGLAKAQTDALVGKTGPEIRQILAQTGYTDAQTNALLAKLPGEIASTQAATAATQATTQRTLALTPLEAQNLQNQGILTQAQANQIINEGPAKIAQLEASGELTSAQAAEVRQRMGMPSTITTDTTQPYLAQRMPDGTINWVPNQNFLPDAKNAPAAVSQLQQRARDMQQQLQQKVASGQLSAEDAAKQFDDFWSSGVDPYAQALQSAQQQTQFENQLKLGQDQRAQEAQDVSMYQTAQTAGQNAASRVAQTIPNMVGPGFAGVLNQLGQSFATHKMPGNLDIGSAVSYQMPDLNTIAHQATAEALAHISPTAAQIAGRPMPSIPQGLDIGSLLNRTNFTPAAPTTTISPDGTVTIQHTAQPAPGPVQSLSPLQPGDLNFQPPDYQPDQTDQTPEQPPPDESQVPDYQPAE